MRPCRSATPTQIAKLAAMLAFGAFAFCLSIVGGAAQAANFGWSSGDVAPTVPVATMRDLKFRTVVRQRYDFSCGSAALATLLTFHYARPTTEQAAFQAMWDVGDRERIKKLGFSLLEMKQYLQSIGLTADGYRLSLDRLEKVGVPGIALVEVRGYRHFVVIKGVAGDTVLVGDPSRGLLRRTRKEFQKHWDGTIMFIRSDVALGKSGFNAAADWSLAPGGAGKRALDVESLQSLALSQARPSYSTVTYSSAFGN